MTAPTAPQTADPVVDDDAIVGTVSTMMDGDDQIEIKDFTLKIKRYGFKIDQDIFHAHAAMGLPAMQDLIKVSKSIGDAMRTGEYDAITEIFKQLLDGPSGERFAQRVISRGADAIDVRKQLLPVIYWLLEKHGLRPTQPSSASSTGSPSGTGGTSSTAGSLTGATD